MAHRNKEYERPSGSDKKRSSEQTNEKSLSNQLSCLCGINEIHLAWSINYYWFKFSAHLYFIPKTSAFNATNLQILLQSHSNGFNLMEIKMKGKKRNEWFDVCMTFQLPFYHSIWYGIDFVHNATKSKRKQFRIRRSNFASLRGHH